MDSDCGRSTNGGGDVALEERTDTPWVPDTYEGGGELIVRCGAATGICLQLHFGSAKVVSPVI